jgi:16S rRNA (cytidine1402-2'-O)-methyltransferase
MQLNINVPKLYIVATPIGNLADITFRAIDTLKKVDLILCEDTRVTRKLLDRYNIDVPMMSYHSNSKISKTEKIIALLNEGKSLALVSDAGTPTISDPGAMLLSQVREQLNDGNDGRSIEIIPIPGASAITTALSIAGVPASEFLFLGFLPHKKGREKYFKEIASATRTVVMYESPHRILKTLTSLKLHLTGARKIVILRELTKIHEQITTGSASEVLDYFESHSDKVRGEFVVVVSIK